MGFDSLRFVKALTAVGVDRPVAEAHAELARDAILGEVATKDDLEHLQERLEREIGGLRRDIEAAEAWMDTRIDALEQRMDSRFQQVGARFEASESRMTIRLGGLIIAGVGVPVALDRLFA